MNNPLKEIKRFLSEDLDTLEDRLKSIVNSRVALIDRISRFVIYRKGKQMRSMFVLLVSKCLGIPNETTYRSLAMIELLHTATLIHDDVVDNSSMRRSFFSVNAIWKNKIAVLIGDYFFAKILLIALEKKEYEILEIVSQAIKNMSEGELLQAEQSRSLDISEEKYFETIEKKTASLIGTCFSVGSYSISRDIELAEKYYKVGIDVGLAFQIKDDLFDYEDIKAFSLGKPVGVDIKEKKITLPLIYTLKQVSSVHRKKILSVIKKKKPAKKDLAEIIETVKKSGGVDYTRTKNLEIIERAKNKMRSIAPPSEARDMLFHLIDHVIYRKV